MILVEVIPWYSNATPNGKERYYWYPLSGGTPRILFNGLIYSPLTGTANYSTIKSRTVTGETSTISGTIKNISDDDLSNMVINGMTFKSRSDYPYAATNIFEDEKISVASLSAGESKSFSMTLEGINWDGEGKDGVVFVQETTGKKIIRQSLFID